MKSLEDCYNEIDLIIGHFCATCFSYALAVKDFERIQKEGMQILATQGQKLTLQQFDQISFSFGQGPPSTPGAYFYYTTTHGGFKERIKKDGIDIKILANNSLVLIYHIWEDKYREIIAREYGVQKNQIVHDTFGELRNIRRSIVHNKSRALKECENNTNLKKFDEGGQILFSEQEAYYSFKAIKDALDELKSNLALCPADS
ncbi:MAG: hypothetical protein L6263_04290 [Desulfobacteraceae bacterium]|nr:hypothetical protein [Desulfobacteraceae bacterium]